VGSAAAAWLLCTLRCDSHPRRRSSRVTVDIAFSPWPLLILTPPLLLRLRLQLCAKHPGHNTALLVGSRSLCMLLRLCLQLCARHSGHEHRSAAAQDVLLLLSSGVVGRGCGSGSSSSVVQQLLSKGCMGCGSGSGASSSSKIVRSTIHPLAAELAAAALLSC
jgi:hypothetical protein